MNDDMRRLCQALYNEAHAQGLDIDGTEGSRPFVTAVLKELQAITRERADHDLHEAQIHRYTDIAVRTALQPM